MDANSRLKLVTGLLLLLWMLIPLVTPGVLDTITSTMESDKTDIIMNKLAILGRAAAVNSRGRSSNTTTEILTTRAKAVGSPAMEKGMNFTEKVVSNFKQKIAAGVPKPSSNPKLHSTSATTTTTLPAITTTTTTSTTTPATTTTTENNVPENQLNTTTTTTNYPVEMIPTPVQMDADSTTKKPDSNGTENAVTVKSNGETGKEVEKKSDSISTSTEVVLSATHKEDTNKSETKLNVTQIENFDDSSGSVLGNIVIIFICLFIAILV